MPRVLSYYRVPTKWTNQPKCHSWCFHHTDMKRLKIHSLFPPSSMTVGHKVYLLSFYVWYECTNVYNSTITEITQNLKWTSTFLIPSYLFQSFVYALFLAYVARCVPFLQLSAICYSYIHIHRFTILFSSIKYISHKYTRARTHTYTQMEHHLTEEKSKHTLLYLRWYLHCVHSCEIYALKHTHARETVCPTLLITVLCMKTTTMNLNLNVCVYIVDRMRHW